MALDPYSLSPVLDAFADGHEEDANGRSIEENDSMLLDAANGISLASVMALEHESESALAMAVRAAGSQSAFGRIINKRQSTVSDWLKTGKLLPAEHVLSVEEQTGISRHKLRPDIYPRDAAPADASSFEHAR